MVTAALRRIEAQAPCSQGGMSNQYRTALEQGLGRGRTQTPDLITLAQGRAPTGMDDEGGGQCRNGQGFSHPPCLTAPRAKRNRNLCRSGNNHRHAAAARVRGGHRLAIGDLDGLNIAAPTAIVDMVAPRLQGLDHGRGDGEETLGNDQVLR